MKKQAIAAATLAAFVVMAAVNGLVTAADEGENAVKVTVTGRNYCVEKALHKAEEDAKCSLATYRHALKVTKAEDANGGAIDMEGWTLHYLYSDASKALSSDEALSGASVIIEGTVYKAERVLEVITVAAGQDEEEGFDLGADDDFDVFDYSQGGGSRSGKSGKAR